MNIFKGKVVFDGASAEPKGFSVKLTPAFAKYLGGNPSTIKKHRDYAYEIWYSDLNYPYYYDKSNETNRIYPSGCSSIRNDDIIGRSFDYIYDNKVSFIVHTPHAGGRYSSTCNCGQYADLTKEFVESGKYSDSYLCLPFLCSDGSNEHGLTVNVNIVPSEKGDNSVINPTQEALTTMSCSAIIRYVLDYFKTAEEAIDYLQKHCKLYMPKTLLKQGYDMHFMFCDPTKTYAVEFVNGALEAIDISDTPYLTNFHRHGTVLNADNTVYTPATQTDEADAITTNKITDHGQGLERHNLIVAGYSAADDKAGMRTLLNSLKYSKAYDPNNTPYWHTEFVQGEIKVNSPVAAFAEIEQAAQEEWLVRDRNKGNMWHSVHQVIYDLTNKKMYSIYQEDGVELEFDI